MASLDPDALRIDPDALYWAVLNGLGPKIDDEALRYAFERYLPLPVEGVECRFVYSDAHETWLACGIEKERLARLIGDAEKNRGPLESVRPAALPPFCDRYDAVPVEAFEFRAGEFISPRRSRTRRRLTFASLAALVAVSSIVTAGFLASARSIDSRVEALRADTSARLRAALGDLGVLERGGSVSVEPALVLASSLRKTERARDRTAEENAAPSVAPHGLALLAAWPGELSTAVESIRLDPASITVTGRLADSGDWEPLRAAMAGGMPGWRESSASLNRAREQYRFSLVLERTIPEGTP